MQNKSLHLLRNSIIRIKTTEQVISNLQEIKDENATRFLADMQVKDPQQPHYLDLFIEKSETFINNPSKAASMCTDLTSYISDLASKPQYWEHQFTNENIQAQRGIEEKMNYFLQNCIFIIENQPEFSKIVLNSLSNLSNITYPLVNSFGERCLQTLVRLHQTNQDLRRSIQICIITNVFPNLDKEQYTKVEVNILKGIIAFMEDIKVSDWFEQSLMKNFAEWLRQISKLFQKSKDQDSITEQDLIRIDAVLEFISKSFQHTSFTNEISKYGTIELQGFLEIIKQCQCKVLTAEQQKQNNRILVFVLEILSRAAGGHNRKLAQEIQQSAAYEQALEEDLKNTTDDLQECEWDFRKSDKVKTYQQAQIMNKKLGGLIKAYAQLLVDANSQVLLKDKKGYQIVVSIYKQIKKIDPYIYGSLCNFIYVILPSPNCLTKEENLKNFLNSFDYFNQIIVALFPTRFFEMLKLGQTYGPIIMNSPEPTSFQNMSIKEVQYAYIGIIKVFKVIKVILDGGKDHEKGEEKEKEILKPDIKPEQKPDVKGDVKASVPEPSKLLQKKPDHRHVDHTPHYIVQMKEVLKNLESNNYKSLILNCLEAPNEELRIAISQLLLTIPVSTWELNDLRTMLQMLGYIKTLLVNEMGEDEISAIIIIFCQLVSKPNLTISKALMESQVAPDVVTITLSILKIDMMRNTLGDAQQTEQKIQLAISCVYLLRKCSVYPNLQYLMVQKSTFEILQDCVIAEDRLLKDGPNPILVEQICFNSPPLLQALESKEPVDPTSLVAFRVLMQVASILNKQCFASISAGVSEDLTMTKSGDDTLKTGDLIDKFEVEFMYLAREQWNSWRPVDQNVHVYSDLISRFEVQHTIFSQQNGIERVLTSLQPILSKYKVWNLIDFPQAATMMKLKEFFQLLGQNPEEDFMQKPTTQNYQGIIYHRHALHQKLVGYGELCINPLHLMQFNEQFFETIQEKKTTASSMVDINKLEQREFFFFMSDENSQHNYKAKIALVTSAFLYCVYVSMKFAPDNQIKFTALNQIQHKSKLKKFILLCAASEWCNANVALKLLKIYRIVLKHTFLSQNIDRTQEYEKEVQPLPPKEKESVPKQSEPHKKHHHKGSKDAPKKKTHKQQQEELKAQSFYHCNHPLEDQIESAQYIIQMIQRVLSDFKEIIECLDIEQMVYQMKLLNGIFKTIQLVFKFYMIVVDRLYRDLQLKPELFGQNIFKLLSYVNSLLLPDNLILELTVCVEKISSGRHINELKKRNAKLLDKLFRNIAQALGQLFTLKRYDIKDLFSMVCQRFKSDDTNEILAWANTNWFLDLAIIRLFSDVHPQAVMFSKKIPFLAIQCNLRGLDKSRKLTSESYPDTTLLIFFDGVLFVQLKEMVKDLVWLYNKLSLNNLKVIHQIHVRQFKTIYIPENDNSDSEENVQSTSLELHFQFFQQEMQKGWLDQSSKQVKKDYSFALYFPKAYICTKVNSILNIMMENQYYKFD